MPDDRLHQPHDKLFKSSFGERDTAEAFFRRHFPPAIVALIDWSILKLESGSFVDDELRASESDLLYRVALRATGKESTATEAYVYLLFEHQRREDRWIALRLLTYQTRIWQKHRAAHPMSLALPPILPMVLAQNNQAWSIAPRFHALFDLRSETGDFGGSPLSRYVPEFTFGLIQLATLPFKEIAGTALGTITLRVLKAERTGELMSELVWDEDLLLELSPSHLERILRYIVGVGEFDKTTIEQKLSTLKASAIKENAMTIAEQYLQQGRQEGQQEGRKEGQEIGQLIGRIQLLEDLLGRVATPTEVLAARTIANLQAIHDGLRASLK
jgi:predicted transposase YdaD